MRSWLTRAAIALLFLAILVGGAASLHLRSAQTKAEAAHTPAPIPVQSLLPEAAQGYAVTDRFLGQLEPAQQARLAFERGGLVTAVAVEEGGRVTQGDVIARLDTALLEAERDRLTGQRKQVAANLELARLTAQRQRKLEQQGHASTQRLDEARLGVVALQGELSALDAALRRIAIDIEKSVVRAPFAGRVGARFVDTGSVVDAGMAVIDLLETGRPRARIGLAPEAAAALTVGQAVRLRASGQALVGRVIAVRPDLSTATRTISAIIDLEDLRGLRFGDTVELPVARQVRASGLWLPISALTEAERVLWSVLTLIEAEDGTYRVGQEVVELLHAAGDRVFVRGTLKRGQRVVSGGRNRVIPGQVVTLATRSEAAQ